MWFSSTELRERARRAFDRTRRQDRIAVDGYDKYSRCEEPGSCRHKGYPGLLIGELLTVDGPYKDFSEIT